MSHLVDLVVYGVAAAFAILVALRVLEVLGKARVFSLRLVGYFSISTSLALSGAFAVLSVMETRLGLQNLQQSILEWTAFYGANLGSLLILALLQELRERNKR